MLAYLIDYVQFQSTPPRRRRRLMRGSHTYDSRISIHASAKEATPSISVSPSTEDISIHASAKEATRAILDALTAQNFNPRLREGGDKLAGRFQDVTGIFQSTPPRRRRLTNPTLILRYQISIHASAKEATATYCNTSAIMYISSLNNFFVRYF